MNATDASEVESDPDETLLPQAFAVKPIGADFDPTVPPTNGEDYLRFVRFEAQRCPNVMVAANIDPRAFDVKQTVGAPEDSGLPATDDTQLPSPYWQAQVVSAFSAVRQLINHVRSTEQHNGETAPLLNAVAALDQPSIIRLLEYHCEWTQGPVFSGRQATWLYATLAGLDRVFVADTAATLRDICRHMLRIRTELTQESGDAAPLAAVNLVIVLIGDYFKQHDLLI